MMLFGEKLVGKDEKAIKETHQDMGKFDALKEKYGSSNGHNSTFGRSFANYNAGYYHSFSGDYMEAVNPYALNLPMHFDDANIPPEVEELVPLPRIDFRDYIPTYLSQPLEPTLQLQHHSGVPITSPAVRQYSQTPLNMKKPDNGPQDRRRKLGNQAAGSSKFSESNKKPNIFYASHHGSANNYGVHLLPLGAPQWGGVRAPMMTSYNPYPSNFVGSSYHHHPGAGPVNQAWSANTYHAQTLPYYNYAAPYTYTPSFVHADPGKLFYTPWADSSVGDANTGATADSIVATISDEAREEILKKFRSFKQFDVVEDVSDHAFVNVNSSMQHQPRHWAKRIQEEWKSLEKDLPATIFVRVYESRIDLMRAVIIGAEGTPYHDGLFFFDVFFPSNYPYAAPQVHYHSGGLQLNPNLYSCGKVCLSLLNTWVGGHRSEHWIPGVSTILQVLVSIQGLILVAKPYFNEPGNVGLEGTQLAENSSLEYNEETFMLSLKTMVYIMRKNPKNFEDFVAGYFCSRADDIMMACKAMEGAQVGCVVKGGVQDVDQGDKSCSGHFRGSVSELMQMLSKEFTRIGAKDYDRLFRITTAAVDSSGGMLMAAAGNPFGGMPGGGGAGSIP